MIIFGLKLDSNDLFFAWLPTLQDGTTAMLPEDMPDLPWFGSCGPRPGDIVMLESLFQRPETVGHFTVKRGVLLCRRPTRVQRMCGCHVMLSSDTERDGIGFGARSVAFYKST